MNMKIIAHRKNTIAALRATPTGYGIEIDIRSRGRRLILQHEPFADGEDFPAWLRHYRHGTLILNVKEDGIEDRVKKLVDSAGVRDYFFLDLSFPALVRMARSGEKRAAARFSEYESLETVLSLKGKAAWVWVDCFSRSPLDRLSFARLSSHFKICVVSPEIQGHGAREVRAYRRRLKPFSIDAVCTKRPGLWRD